MSSHFTPVTFGESALHAGYFSPAGDLRANVLLLSALFEEKRCAQRAMTVCAHALADAGAAVLHVDLYGTGNSAGDLAGATMTRWQADIATGADWLAAHHPGAPLTLLGCRAGGLLAANSIANGLDADTLILWQPILAGRSYLQQLRTRRMIQDKITGEAPPVVGDFEVEGQDLSPELFATLQELRMPPELPPALKVRLLQCSFNEKITMEYTKQLAQWGEGRVPARSIICEPFWNPHSPGDYRELAQSVVEEVLL